MKLRSGCLCSLFFLPVLFLSCGKEEVREEIIRPVRYIQVFSTGGSQIRSFSGVAQAGLESNLSFKVPGTIKQVAVKVGDKVKAGDLVARLDPTDYQLKVQQSEASLANAQAQARNTKANYERIRTLYENNSASRSELDGARAAYESADAGVKAAEKQLEMARLQLSYTTLRAPTAGAIAQVNVELNEYVKTGNMVVVLTSGTQIEVKVSIPEVLITRIKEGSKVTVTFDAIPDKEFTATVREVGVAAVGVGTTFPVTVRLDKEDPTIRPGMAASAAFLFESKDERERFVVPSHAVVEDREGRFVYVVDPMPDETGYGSVRRRSVTVGDLTAEGLEIFEGLSDGDLVVTAGVGRITHGQKVKM
ncbi:MAG: efflux RND transporter periplasmic adaptor subunit [candidate division Zixibacteria bacterium]|nr:efflux RND transporter periplasmic adaptor subunit [candidate division Zixibacteria bacterium]